MNSGKQFRLQTKHTQKKLVNHLVLDERLIAIDLLKTDDRLPAFTDVLLAWNAGGN